MRQAGVIAAAGIIALQEMVSRLADDHATAQRLAHGLARIPDISIHPEKFQTNILVFELPLAIIKANFIQRLDAQGVRLLEPCHRWRR